MWYEFLTEYPCKYFLWPPSWVKAIRTAGSTAEGRFYRHYWFLIMESTAFCCWVKNSILWVVLFSVRDAHQLVNQSIRVVKVSICYIDSDEELIFYWGFSACAGKSGKTDKVSIFTGSMSSKACCLYFCTIQSQADFQENTTRWSAAKSRCGSE